MKEWLESLQKTKRISSAQDAAQLIRELRTDKANTDAQSVSFKEARPSRIAASAKIEHT
jgi:hypothetical protein